MLCDDLLADKKLLDCYDGLDKVYARIRVAQKFVLSREFAVAADGFVENLPELCKIVPYCRLPYPATWIEWLHDDRPHWNPDGPFKARPVDIKRHQISPQRIGLLLEQQGDFAGCWRTHLFWSLKQAPGPDESMFNGSLGAVVIDVRKIVALGGALEKLESVLETRYFADFGQGFLGRVMAVRPDIAERLGEYIVEDWGGEIRFMVAMLGLMNTKNVFQAEVVDKAGLNKKRAKIGKLPLFSHKLLKIRPQMLAHAGRSGGGGREGELRSHFVKGHFKERRTGLFWWSHHMRGRIALGHVHKDYEVEG